ncbi:MAG: Gfo/Idh/MocA family oxidoreductase [Bacteroidales bacterium]|nr:Gfo/Idh/MocA family oxidoreductase [Bacteroidales bacterium]
MINWNIIDCGNVTKVKNVPPFTKIKGFRLVAVMKRNAELAKDYAARNKVLKAYTDASELIRDPEINAVYMTTPPDNHAEYSIMSAKADKPVYIEKSMARTCSTLAYRADCKRAFGR